MIFRSRFIKPRVALPGLTATICKRRSSPNAVSRRRAVTSSVVFEPALPPFQCVHATALPQCRELLRRVPIAAAHHTALFDIFLIGKVAQPRARFTIRRHVVTHETLYQDVEHRLTLIAFTWRAPLCGKNPAHRESQWSKRGVF